MSPPESDIVQLDGNVSLNSSIISLPGKQNKFQTALALPIMATYNLRSLCPKIKSLKCDIIERGIDVAFLQEIWEKDDNEYLQSEIEKLLEIDGLEYISNPRPVNSRGLTYGGAAVIVNKAKFSAQKIDVNIPKNLEAVWVLVKPKTNTTKFKKFIACSFYSPPGKLKNTRLADHIVTTLHLLSSRYPDCGLILGADRNGMDISPILDCGLKLRQIVDKNTRGKKILDIIVTNLYSFYNSPIICPPIGPDDLNNGLASDHSVPVCIPHTDRFNPPARKFRIIKYRPLSQSDVGKFGEWITGESWQSINDDSSPTEQVTQLNDLLFHNLDKFCPEKL